MTPDEHTACPGCPQVWRDLYATGRSVLARPMMIARFFSEDLPPELEELRLAIERVKPFVEAHHANQLHAHSRELENARDPKVVEPTVMP